MGNSKWTAAHCGECGALLACEALEGLCPRCLMALNFAPEAGREAIRDPAPDVPVRSSGGNWSFRYTATAFLGERQDALISFIVPARNEEAYIGSTLRAIRQAAAALPVDFEIIVVDDASSDRTAEIAATHGARVLRVGCEQIAATRNAGAQVALGGVYVFVDADMPRRI